MSGASRFGDAYAYDADTARLAAGLGVVAHALNRGDMAHAMISAVMLKLPDLDWDGAVRIAQADDALAKFDPDQPRDPDGRWTATGAAGVTNAASAGFQTVGIDIAPEFEPWWGDSLEIGGRLPAWVRALPRSIREMPRERIPKIGGKEQSDDIPSWARQASNPKSVKTAKVSRIARWTNVGEEEIGSRIRPDKKNIVN